MIDLPLGEGDAGLPDSLLFVEVAVASFVESDLVEGDVVVGFAGSGPQPRIVTNNAQKKTGSFMSQIPK